MKKKSKKAEKTAKKVPGVPFKQGNDPRRNLEGRPAGVKNFATIFEEAVKKIAKEKNLKEADVEVDLVIKAIAEARGGHYKYYQDIFDRIYGKAKDSLDITSGGISLKELFDKTSEEE